MHRFDAEPVDVETMVGSTRATKIAVASVSRPLQAIGRIKSDTVAIVRPIGNTRALVNNRRINANDTLVLPPQQSVVAYCGEDANLLLVMLPARSSVVKRLLEPQLLTRLQDGETVQVAKDSSEGVRLRSSIVPPLRQIRQQRKHNFRVRSSIGTQPQLRESRCDLNPAHADERIIWSAVNYIEANLTEAIPISELSEVSAISLSKLERTFRRKLNMTPSQYILARRLASARRRLVISEPGATSIAAVALDSGFTHLGRFSGAYRRQFGELPKETLQLV
jgi:transcriptional regulator GlxA family with amidase domain